MGDGGEMKTYTSCALIISWLTLVLSGQDLENGLWAGEQRVTPSNTALNYPFVTAMVKGGAHGFALKAGDATQGHLQTMWSGPRPQVGKNGTAYQPMAKQGAIILGIGGDNSDQAIGTFFEGRHYSS